MESSLLFSLCDWSFGGRTKGVPFKSTYNRQFFLLMKYMLCEFRISAKALASPTNLTCGPQIHCSWQSSHSQAPLGPPWGHVRGHSQWLGLFRIKIPQSRRKIKDYCPCPKPVSRVPKNSLWEENFPIWGIEIKIVTCGLLVQHWCHCKRLLVFFPADLIYSLDKSSEKGERWMG